MEKIEDSYIYRIVDRESGGEVGVYSRAYTTEYDFGSPEAARRANCNDIHADKSKYGIRKYKVTIELVEEDVDGWEPPKETVVGTREWKMKQKEIELGRPLTHEERLAMIFIDHIVTPEKLLELQEEAIHNDSSSNSRG